MDFISETGELMCENRGPSPQRPHACECTGCEASSFGPSLSKEGVRGWGTLRHADHHDQLLSTNEAGTEFALVCGNIARASDDFCACCVKGAAVKGSVDPLSWSDEIAMLGTGAKFMHDNLRLLDEDEAERLILEFTTSGLLELGSDRRSP